MHFKDLPARYVPDYVVFFPFVINYTSEARVRNPTGPFTILEPKDQEIGKFHAIQEGHTMDFEAPKL